MASLVCPNHFVLCNLISFRPETPIFLQIHSTHRGNPNSETPGPVKAGFQSGDMLQALLYVKHLENSQLDPQSLLCSLCSMTLLFSTFVYLVVLSLSVCQAGC